ncbi:hypothetical protein [Zymomonas sp.]|uniref:hypothetical protein n=1 Tax=Zymomonas sp. TaxID=2068624 RepID=UPI0025FCDB83|nr:hypothetical protein [Zymomonas sp.]MCA1956503.1 hypothetical protein [Zymomonas sp.]
MHGSQWMVVIIVALVLITGLLKSRYRYQGEIVENLAENDNIPQMQQEIKALKDRIATLERIVTDNYHNLALDQAITALDQPISEKQKGENKVVQAQ